MGDRLSGLLPESHSWFQLICGVVIYMTTSRIKAFTAVGFKQKGCIQLNRWARYRFLLVYFFGNKGQMLFQQHGAAALGNNVFDLFCVGHYGPAELGNPCPLERLLAHGG